jgi:hypothetical protein
MPPGGAGMPPGGAGMPPGGAGIPGGLSGLEQSSNNHVIHWNSTWWRRNAYSWRSKKLVEEEV